MEYRVQWLCKFCESKRPYCQICGGRGFLREWMPLGFLRALPGHRWVITDRRPKRSNHYFAEKNPKQETSNTYPR
jgi:hypothetical protein